ncbi:response regulator transcription factor [Candidatus Magnetominusculus dajiuhuensis]|uniref:helix-turn-helix transcriptional regulator n=1 Tax=Candidatus Magnetominusculus dajiuhuensis TaxID=3137712 RepID=UPI003B42EE73
MLPDYERLIKDDYIGSHLSSDDLLGLVEIIHQLSLCGRNDCQCCKDNVFYCIVGKLRSLVPFEYIFFSLLRYKIDYKIKHPDNIIVLSPGKFGFPEEYTSAFKKQEHYCNEPLIKKLLEKNDCYYCGDIYNENPPLKGLAELINKYNIMNGYITGQKDIASNVLYYYLVAGNSLKNDERSYIILSDILIFIKHILSRLFNFTKLRLSNVTPREIEVVQCMADGATNEEISSVLHISVNTVKSHIASISGKLGTKNRTQTVALCFAHGILK